MTCSTYRFTVRLSIQVFTIISNVLCVSHASNIFLLHYRPPPEFGPVVHVGLENRALAIFLTRDKPQGSENSTLLNKIIKLLLDQRYFWFWAEIVLTKFCVNQVRINLTAYFHLTLISYCSSPPTYAIIVFSKNIAQLEIAQVGVCFMQ